MPNLTQPTTIGIKNLKELEVWVNDVLVPYLSQQKIPFYLLLTGELGAGKTTLTKILLKKMGVQETITSPTFVILNQYQTPSRTINHMDAYRLDQNQDLAMYFEEFDQGLNIIEWPGNLNVDWSQFAHLKMTLKIIDDHQREILIG